MKTENENANNTRSSKGREARDAALGLFVKAKLAENRAKESAKMSRLRALRLAKEAEDKTTGDAEPVHIAKPATGIRTRRAKLS
ncbi:MAG TPA: hypothetical protein VGO84_12320 [Burkholderiales bacterium]|nr:hypothetical protein [Burkholderiales bacterium]